MKKLITLCAASLVALAGVSMADPVAEVPGVGSVNTGGGYVVVAEGNDDNNLGPASGFVSVSDDGQVCADDNGHAADDDPEQDSSSPSCSPAP